MSCYSLQKLIRSINANPQIRERFMAAPETVAKEAGLLPNESNALIERNYRALYTLGVHGLLLRPFSIIHEVPEPEYLAQIRGQTQ